MLPSLSGHRMPAASTEVPLEMLRACHHRIHHFCDTLQRLATHIAQGGDPQEASQAAAAIRRYFNTAALDHHADEEEDLFPALIESMAGSDPVCIREMINRLTMEHERLESAWQTLDPILERLAQGQSATLDPAVVQAFVTGYSDHIRMEEDELLPMAERLLSQQDIDRIGRAMRERRGIGDDHPDLAGPEGSASV